MPNQDTSQLKEKIISIIRMRGPSLPSHISSQIGMSILFTSAFLSELLSEKKLKISYMKVGSSPVYFLSGQEHLLERYSESLKSREKDAFMLLKEKKFLRDADQEPAIRVALRAIRDFAIPFQRDDKLYWRYLSANESEFVPRPVVHSSNSSVHNDLGIFEKKNREEKKEKKPKSAEKKKTIKKKSSKRKTPEKKKKTGSGKGNDKFFNKVKEYLLGKGVEISDIISFSKDDLVLKVKQGGVESIIFAYNKKRINEEDIVKAHKKVSEFNLKFSILCLGEPAKKTLGLIDAVKHLSEIKNIE